jgi:putative transcriptional regulator
MCYHKEFMKKKILLLLFFIFQISLFHYIFALAESPKNYLKGKFYSSVKDHFLIATEKMKDDRFEKTVIIMLESDENGAWGIVINRRLGTMPIALLIDPSLNTSEEREKLYKINIPIFWGGPVDVKQIFILHTTEYQSDTTKNYGNISITQDYNILFDIAENKGPEKSLIIFGYSGWGSGQLEGEMERDHWILSDIDLNIIFNEESNTKWNKAYKNSFIKI